MPEQGLGVLLISSELEEVVEGADRVLVLTNGCGGLDERWTPGTPVLISDHVNLTGTSPIPTARISSVKNPYSCQ